MHLPWDRNYFKICFYAVLTFGACYVMKLGIDAAQFLLTSFGDVLAGMSSLFRGFFSLLSPLMIGIVIAYVLDPMTEILQRQYISVRNRWMKKHDDKQTVNPPKMKTPAPTGRRTAGVALAYLLLIGCLAVPVVLLTQNHREGGGFLAGLGSRAGQAAADITNFYHALHLKLMASGAPLYISDMLAQFIDGLSSLMARTGGRLAASVPSAGKYAARLIMGVIIAFYLLRDKSQILNGITRLSEQFLPIKIRRVLQTGIGDIHAVFSGYIRGQLTDAAIMAVLVGLWLSFLGVPFAASVGIITGFSNIIPYFGALVGFVLSILAALLGGEPMKAVYAGIGILVLQQIDGLYIGPRVVGKRVELGPVVILLALSAAGQLFGMIGMILAVPLCAVCKVFVMRLIERKVEGKERS